MKQLAEMPKIAKCLKCLKLRNSFHFKKDGASLLRRNGYEGRERHPQIFNLQSSIFNSGLPGLGICH